MSRRAYALLLAGSAYATIALSKVRAKSGEMKKYLRYIILAGIVVVVVCVSSAVAVYISYQNSSNSGKSTTKPTQTTQSKQIDDKKDEADKLAHGGDVQGGVAILDDAIKNSSDAHAKFQFYTQKAILLFNNNKLDEALVAAKQAYTEEKTKDGAAFVGQIARQKGDRALAIEYYKKAINLVDANASPMADEDKKYYEGIVAELEGGK